MLDYCIKKIKEMLRQIKTQQEIMCQVHARCGIKAKQENAETNPLYKICSLES